ncbi:MAG: hypothetical protein IPN71_04895 [Fibrobacteres bacterium]|nr:hypothetical protein [Fibrobacterota bacterium]
MVTSPSYASWIDRLPAPLGRPLPTWLVLVQSHITLLAVLLFLRTIDADFLASQWDADPMAMFLRLFVPALPAAGGWLLFFGRRESAIVFLLHASYLVFAGVGKSPGEATGAVGVAIDAACAIYALRILPGASNDGIRPFEAALPWILRRPTLLWSIASLCMVEAAWSVPWDFEKGSMLTRAMEGASELESALLLSSSIGVFASALFMIALRREALYAFGFVLACMFFLVLGDMDWFAKFQLAKGALICVYLAVLSQRGVLCGSSEVGDEAPVAGGIEDAPESNREPSPPV